jgi:hypothetical protein
VDFQPGTGLPDYLPDPLPAGRDKGWTVSKVYGLVKAIDGCTKTAQQFKGFLLHSSGSVRMNSHLHFWGCGNMYHETVNMVNNSYNSGSANK